MASIAARPSVYIDGQSGTTGLRIRQLLAGRDDLQVIEIDHERRREAELRRAHMVAADVTVLCLPDDAARQAVALVGSDTRIIDASSAHRVVDEWVYGLPELSPGQRDAIRKARRVSNPGCYPTGVNLLLRPLVDSGLLPSDIPITIHALSGYSGGGKAKIERWEDVAQGLPELRYEAPYALEQRHKHVPEMVRYTGLSRSPAFYPAVGPFHNGMRVEIPLHAALLPAGASAHAMLDIFQKRYADEAAVRVSAPDGLPREERALDPQRCNGLNIVELTAIGHADGHVLLCALLDNLAKGASGAAVQNLNLMLGLDEFAGLRLR